MWSSVALASVVLAKSQCGPDLESLKTRLDKVATSFHGRLGYCVVDLNSGKRIDFKGMDLFPTASTIKTSVALEALCQVDEGKRKMSDKHVLMPTKDRQASMWTYSMKEETSLDLDGFVNLMIGVSDNTATMQVQDWIGSQSINARMSKLGLLNTKILGHRSDRDSREDSWQKQFGWGMTTPREQARLFELLFLHKAASPAVCEKLLRILSRQYWDDIAIAACPIDVKVCAKSGAVSKSRSEVALVYAARPYVLALYTADQQDTRWVSDNEGEVALRKMSKMIWDTFEPNRPYELPQGYEKFNPTGGGVGDS
jgi:beta-lactamase class A